MLRSIVKESVKQAPSLGVLAVIVYLFIGALQHSNTFITGLSEACHANQNKAASVIEENTKQLGRVERALDDTNLILARMNGR